VHRLVIAARSFVLVACSGNGDSGERGGSGRVGPTAVSEQEQAQGRLDEASENLLTLDPIGFSYSARSLSTGPVLGMTGTAYPSRPAWAFRSDATGQEWYQTATYEFRSVGGSRWASFESRYTRGPPCWITLRSTAWPFGMPGWQARRPRILALTQHLLAVGPETGRPGGIVAELPWEHALLLVPHAEPLAVGTTAPDVPTTVTVSIDSDGGTRMRLEGRDLIRSARQAGVKLRPKRAADLANHAFTLWIGPSQTHPIKAGPPPEDMIANSLEAAERGECGRSG
jgi:hypothetical protein